MERPSNLLDMCDRHAEPAERCEGTASPLFHGSMSASGAPHDCCVMVSAYLFLVAAPSHKTDSEMSVQRQGGVQKMVGRLARGVDIEVEGGGSAFPVAKLAPVSE